MLLAWSSLNEYKVGQSEGPIKRAPRIQEQKRDTTGDSKGECAIYLPQPVAPFLGQQPQHPTSLSKSHVQVTRPSHRITNASKHRYMTRTLLSAAEVYASPPCLAYSTSLSTSTPAKLPARAKRCKSTPTTRIEIIHCGDLLMRTSRAFAPRTRQTRSESEVEIWLK